jgi:hypothetical protein
VRDVIRYGNYEESHYARIFGRGLRETVPPSGGRTLTKN